MRFPEPLETARLLLRKPRPDDAHVIFREYAQDPSVTRYLIWSPHASVRETEAYIVSAMALWDSGVAYPYVITEKATDGLLGMIEMRPHGHRADFGYALARRQWGRGFGTEAISALVGIAIAMPQIHRVEATCDVENVASARVLEKAGLTREGLLRRYIVHPTISNEPRDSYMYALVK